MAEHEHRDRILALLLRKFFQAPPPEPEEVLLEIVQCVIANLPPRFLMAPPIPESPEVSFVTEFPVSVHWMSSRLPSV